MVSSSKLTAEENLQLSREVARFVATTDDSQIPDEIYEHAKLALVDWFGVTAAGSKEPLTLKLIKHAEFLGGNSQSSIIGHKGKKVSVTQAALINGSASHAHDFDDTHAVFRGHASASMFATLFALAEVENKSGKEVLTAYLLGLHATLAIAECNAKEIYMKGIHNTSALGIIASALAGARLLELNEEQTLNVLGLAATQAFGFKASFGTMAKPYHAGHAAEGAVAAVLLARDGFTGAKNILEGPNGMFAALGGEVIPQAITDMGKKWGIEQLAVKYHASCHWTHSPIEALLAIQKKNSLKYQDVVSIEILVSEVAMKTADIQQPKTGLEGKFSIPYTAVNGLVTGKTGIPAFTNEAVRNKDIATLISNTKVRVTPEMVDFAAKATVKTKNGKTYVGVANVMKEFPELPEKTKKIKRKYDEIAIPILGEQKSKTFMDAIMDLDEMEDVSELLKISREN